MWKNLIFLATGMFSVGSSNFLIAGLLPQIGQTINQPVAVSGQGMSVFSLAYLLSAPLFSIVFADKPAKQTFQLALSVFVIGNMITLLSQDIAVFLIARCIAGIGAGIFTPLCISIAVCLVSATAKGRGLSLVWSANSAGVVFGVPLGLYLSSLFQWQVSVAYLVFLALVSLIGFSMQDADIKLPPPQAAGERFRILIDPKTLSVVGISCFTAVASLGLYSYVTLLQSGSPNSLGLTLFSWGLGGFLGSSAIGFFTDRCKNPRLTMTIILFGLMLTLISIPFTRELPFIGLIPFFMWGAFGWAIPTPQQQILYELHENEGTILAALNSSAFGLGAALGTAVGGLIISAGFNESYLPFPAAILLLFVLIGQLIINKKNLNSKVKSNAIEAKSAKSNAIEAKGAKSNAIEVESIAPQINVNANIVKSNAALKVVAIQTK